MNIYQYDMNPMSASDKEAFLSDTSNRAKLFWKEKQKPSNGWAVPYVTGHRYRLTWANDLDFTVMNVEISERWNANDKDTRFVLPFVDAREAINVTRMDSGDFFGTQIADKSLLETRTSWTSGHNWLQNATDIREFQFAVNGKDMSIQKLKLEGLQCISGDCPQDTIKPIPIDPNAMYWSDVNTWSSGMLP